MIKDNPIESLPGFSFYRLLVRPFLMFMEAERAHDFVTGWLTRIWKTKFGRECTRKLYASRIQAKPVRLGRLELKNSVGLAAGFDKNALLIPGIETLGFGFVEIGTVTPRAQAGNPKPRIVREASRRALINRMGFPNDGMDVIFERLQAAKPLCSIPIGVNIGKNKETPNDDAIVDYLKLIDKFASLADWFTVNISSPNTPGLRALQTSQFVSSLAWKLKEKKLSQPVLLKLSPDLPLEDLKEICSFCGDSKGFTGLVLTNTQPTDLGGISGWPLKKGSLAMLARARSFLDKNVPVISVGGIETKADVQERLSMGATAVQIYTAMIYQGPGLVRKLLQEK